MAKKVKPSSISVVKSFQNSICTAVLSGDAEKMHGLENCFIGMAREVVFECMVYI